MELEFTEVSYDGELADFSDEDLRELVSEFESAQESNVAEFEQAAEAVDEIDENTIEDFEQAREELVEEIAEAEAFDQVPVTEDSLAEADFSELREWQDFVTAQGTEADEETDEEAEEFDDMGKKTPTNNEDEIEDFAETALENIQGLNI
jgi:hypothetical protein